MCYVPHIKKLLLFAGGNVQTQRGDPGTWTYDPAANTWKELQLDTQPPQRALSPLVYDPVNEKVILFGGDRLDQLLSDTWTFDGRKWQQQQPTLAPAPRAGHALLWLAGAKRLLLLGGFAYDSAVGYYPAVYRARPLEAWTYDAAANRWEFIAAWSKDCPAARLPHPLRAAAGADDLVAVHAGGTWLCKLDVASPDAAEAAKRGVSPGTVERRQEWCDPDWYRSAPPGDAAQTAGELAALPVNTWVLRTPPRRPGFNVDWGSAVFAIDRDLILRFSGGHCAYSGTAPQVPEDRGGPVAGRRGQEPGRGPRAGSGLPPRTRRSPDREDDCRRWPVAMAVLPLPTERLVRRASRRCQPARQRRIDGLLGSDV
jgi:hypothetical protein